MQMFLGVARGEALHDGGEVLGVSERQVRRYRGRYEKTGLPVWSISRLCEASPKRVPPADG
jgi:hypothetical protein